MIAPAGGHVRLARALVLALATIALSALAHLLGGGVLPGPGVVAVLTAVVATTALVASQHRLGAVALTGLLGGGQALLHAAFTILGAPGADPATLGHVVQHGHHASLIRHPATHEAMAGMAGAAGHVMAGHAAQLSEHAGHASHHHATVPMLLAHVVATLITAVLLARGERALWLLAGWLAPVIRLVAQRPADWPRPTIPSITLPRPASADVALAAPRRGPPVLV